MSEIKLSPCPFCGGEATLEGNGHWVVCKECYCESAYYDSTEEAIAQWNTRKPMERIAEQIEFLEHKSIDCVPYINMNDAIEIVKEEGGIE